MRRRSLIYWVVAAVACLLSCSDQGGIGHEGEARISGKLLLPGGAPALQTEVALYPAEYNPVRDSGVVRLEKTDAQGEYHFSNVKPGTYAVVAIHEDRVNRALISGIEYEGADIGIPSKTLQHTGAMKILLSRQVSGAKGYVYIPGTMLFAYVNNYTDYIVLDSVPAGNIGEVTYTATDTSKVTSISRNVVVASNDTAVVTMPGAGYRRSLVLNTTASGGAVAGDVTRFPVLVRLNDGNFNFSQADAAGSDVYFCKPDATLLPHAIERWDSVAKVAEIWVKVDTIFGNDSSQFITMHWGDSSFQPDVAGSTVFDTADGYQGVWHLGEEAASPVLDATDNHYNSGAPQSTFPSVAAGIIGNSRSFDGVSHFMAIPSSASGRLDIPADGHYAVSAWVYLDSLDGGSHCIVSKGFEQYYLRSTNIVDNKVTDVARWEFVEYDGTTGPKPSQSPAKSGEWVYVVGVRQDNQQLLYVNGELTARIDLPSGTIARSSPYNLYIGRFSNGLPSPIDQGYCYFRGRIDELRISSTPRSADWVRLSYMNQRENGTLIRFK